MRTITFYSYKGGVGRTLAATNFAVYLAKLGQKTVLIDFDLDAPGIDSKFQDFNIQTGQKGILDYIIEYQQTKKDPGSIEQIHITIPVEFSGNTTPLYLIPSGDYLSVKYYKKLSQLDWGKIFSEEYEGVAFFQNFLAHIRHELRPDFVIVDSRTGIGEIAGLCTQQLADEVVMISSLSGESIKMTKHIKQLIMQSEIAKALEKSVDVKVVVSRVPKPDDLDSFKKQCCERFDIDETKLFFLFSSPILEQEEFLAVNIHNKDEELLSNYVRLFYGLNIDLASEDVKNEVEQASRELLKVSPEESERRILELTALYPHPDVYRAAMHFFQLRRNATSVETFGWKLLDLIPEDEESLSTLAKFYLADYNMRNSFTMLYRAKDNLIEHGSKDIIRILEILWHKGKLEAEETLKYAKLLESNEQYLKSYDVALDLCNNKNLDASNQIQASLIAARCALKLDKQDVAINLIIDIPQEELDGELASLMLENRQNSGDLEGAFKMAKQLLNQDINSEILEKAANLANQLGRIEELEETIRYSRSFVSLLRPKNLSSPETRQELRELHDYSKRFGMLEFANYIERLLNSIS
jgi:MinD-like ATPase involved in chromosome partitioning or flagellar assembly